MSASEIGRSEPVLSASEIGRSEPVLSPEGEIGRQRRAYARKARSGEHIAGAKREKRRIFVVFCGGWVIKMAGGGADVCVVRSVGYWWIDELIRD